MGMYTHVHMYCGSGLTQGTVPSQLDTDAMVLVCTSWQSTITSRMVRSVVSTPPQCCRHHSTACHLPTAGWQVSSGCSEDLVTQRELQGDERTHANHRKAAVYPLVILAEDTLGQLETLLDGLYI